MARVYSDSGQDLPHSERRTLEALRTLDDRWTVFHSTAWQSIRNGRQADGEADVILLHPRRGLLVLEVKGGRLKITEGDWWSIDRHNRRHRIKDPFRQAVDSKYSLLRYLRERGVNTRQVPICHGVVFPDVLIEDRIGWSAPRDIVIDVAGLRIPAASVAKVFEHWNQTAALTPAVESELVRLVRPTVTLRLPLRESLESAREHLVRMTDVQLKAFRQLRRNRRALVLGGAGTGKTVLALARAREFAEMGHATLLTCYNSLLADHLSRMTESVDLVEVRSFHALCVSEARTAGLAIPRDPGPAWWEVEAPRLLMQAARSRRRFEAIVVDEGQDFAAGWISALLQLAGDDETPFYVFADSHQELFDRNWAVPDSWPQFILDLNCRNTRRIAELVAGVYGDDVESMIGGGAVPLVHSSAGREEGAQIVQAMVHRLLTDERLEPEQVAVLSDDRRFVDRLRSKLAGDHPFTPFGGTGVIAETVQRFKGLESDVVVLQLSDSLLAAGDKGRRFAYVGMSRAKLVLVVIASRKLLAELGLEVSGTWPS